MISTTISLIDQLSFEFEFRQIYDGLARSFEMYCPTVFSFKNQELFGNNIVMYSNDEHYILHCTSRIINHLVDLLLMQRSMMELLKHHVY
jgi:hypothetical protein